MPKIDLTVFANNDPDFLFNLFDKHDRTRSAANLTGAAIECYVKATAATKDTDADMVYDGVIQGAATSGQVLVQMDAEDVGGDDRQFYHLDVIRNGRRQTYAWGLIKKIGFA